MGSIRGAGSGAAFKAKPRSISARAPAPTSDRAASGATAGRPSRVSRILSVPIRSLAVSAINGCAACIDACDEVMQKLHRPKGLVRYGTLMGQLGQTATWRSPELRLLRPARPLARRQGAADSDSAQVMARLESLSPRERQVLDGLLAGHPKMTVTVVTSEQSAGKPVAALFPSLASVVPLSPAEVASAIGGEPAAPPTEMIPV